MLQIYYHEIFRAIDHHNHDSIWRNQHPKLRKKVKQKKKKS
jgi:hypothetical protein